MRFRIGALIVFVAAGLAVSPSAQSPSAETMLEAARKLEVVDGDLPKAIAAYQAIVDAHGDRRAIAADALLRLGGAHEKLGDVPQARAAYERLVRSYPDQIASMSTARGRLAAFGDAAHGAGDREPSTRAVTDGEPILTAQGRVQPIRIENVRDGLFVIDRRTNIKTRLVAVDRETEEIPGFVLSADATRIAYTWVLDDEVSELRMIATRAGSSPRVVLPRHAEMETVWPHGWSADGREVFTEIEAPDGSWRFVWVSVDDGRVRGLRSLGWRRQRPRDVMHVAFSPDGRYVAYSALAVDPGRPVIGAQTQAAFSRAVDKRIYILAADGSSEVELTDSAGVSELPVWTPDGAHVLFLSSRGGSIDLWAVSVRDGRPTGRPVVVRSGLGLVIPIGMTTEGDYYYKKGVVSQRIAISSVDQLGADPATPLRGDANSFLGSSPAWSPDGRSLAFVTGRFNSPSAIVVRSVHSGVETQYAPPDPASTPGAPAWLRRSEALIVPTEGEAARRLGPRATTFTRLDLGTGQWKELVTVQHFGFTISPDDGTLYFLAQQADRQLSDSRFRIVSVDLVTLRQNVVFAFDDEGAASNLTISPDGATLWMARHGDRDRQFVTVSLTDGTYTVRYRPGAPASILGWLDAGHTLVVRTPVSAGSVWKLMALPANGGGEPRTLGFASVGGTSLSPDAKWLALNTSATVTEVWSIENLSAALGAGAR
jgi:dipeptidyl aminopeptidase/acylaminoacyl peptidase